MSEEKKLNGTVIVTYRCNARCSMCNRYKAPSKPEEEISIETINGLSKWSERKPSTSLKRGVSLMSRLQLRAIRLMLRVPVFWTRSLAAW